MSVRAVGVARRAVWGGRKSGHAAWDKPNLSPSLHHCVQSKSKERELARELRWVVVAGTGEGHGALGTGDAADSEAEAARDEEEDPNQEEAIGSGGRDFLQRAMVDLREEEVWASAPVLELDEHRLPAAVLLSSRILGDQVLSRGWD
jgi:hypothetical protein